MVVALELVFLFASGMLGKAGYVLIGISSVFAYVLTTEKLYGTCAISFVLTSLIAWLIVPDKASAVAFLLIFGHYPMFKAAVDSANISKGIGFFLKLIYCNLFVTVGLAIVLFVLKKSIPQINLPKYIVILLLELVFVLLDFVHTFLRWIYVDKLRSMIVHE